MYWHSSFDHFVSDLTSSKVTIYMKDQIDEKPQEKDDCLGWWAGEFINDLLGKGNYNVAFRQFSVRPREFYSLPQTCTANLSFGYAPVHLDFDIGDSFSIHF